MSFLPFSLFGRARSNKAAVLVLTLWIVVILSVIASSLAFDVQVNSKLALIQKEQLVAQNLAKSAVAVGMTHLQNDRLIDHEENANQPYDALSDVWNQPHLRTKEREVKLGKGTYHLEVVDEQGKININVASVKVLKGILEYYGYEPPDSDEIANAIIDWKDQDDVALGDTAAKENEYYSALLGQKITRNTVDTELIYQTANEPFIVEEELLDVAGITPELFYGYDPETVDPAELQKTGSSGGSKSATGRRTRSRRKQQRPMSEIITVRGNGRVNVNTASEEVLTILLYAGQNNTNMEAAHAAAKAIIDARGTSQEGRAPNPDDAFKSAADLQKVSGVNGQALSGNQLGISIGFNSDIFSIIGTGRVGSIQKTVTAVVERSFSVYNPDDSRLLSNAGKSSLRNRPSVRNRSRRGKSEESDNYIRIPEIRVLQWIE